MSLHSQKTFDYALVLKAAGLIAASANSATILDLGPGFMDADVVLDVTALEVDSNNESYEIILQGSNVSTFGTAADIVPLTSISMGEKDSTRLAALASGANDAVGRYVLPFRNERNGTVYRYVRLAYIVAGTIGTGINFSAFIAKK